MTSSNVSERRKIENKKINFYNSQVISGHGNFQSYLLNFKIADTPGSIDDLKHFLFECPAFSRIRASFQLQSSIQITLSLR